MTFTAAADTFPVLQKLRETRPLVQNITNFVTMAVSANVLLAVGASPAMVHAREEIEDFSAIASSLVVNIGTLSSGWIESMMDAARYYGAAGKPWVLDPVGVGATGLRTRVSADLVSMRPAVIRANASEIMALAGATATVRGVDSTDSSASALDSARRLANRSGAVVAVTGATDYVTDGDRVFAIEGGHELMPLSTGLGCALSAVVAAFQAVASPFNATLAALAVYAAAGRIACEKLDGPGQVPAGLCDALYRIDLDQIIGNCTLREVTP